MTWRVCLSARCALTMPCRPSCSVRAGTLCAPPVAVNSHSAQHVADHSVSSRKVIPFRSPMSNLTFLKQGTHCTGKTGEMPPPPPPQKKILSGRHREFRNFVKTQGIWFAQFVNSLILRVKIFQFLSRKISKNKSVLCM